MQATKSKSKMLCIILLVSTLMQTVVAMPSPEEIAAFKANYTATLDTWLATKTNETADCFGALIK